MNELLIYLDTETTGIGKGHKIVQLAYLYEGKFVNVLFNPGFEMEQEVIDVHHITNEMVKDKGKFEDSIEVQRLRTLIDEHGGVVIAHNAEFDISMLEQEGLKCNRYIDTLKLAQYVRDEHIEEFEACNLQYLRDFYHLEFKEDIRPHDAYSDVVVLKGVYDKLQANFGNVEEMIDLSMKPMVVKKFWFGKYKGMTIEQVSKDNPQYLEWMKKKIEEKDETEWSSSDKNLHYSISFYLNNI